MLLLTKSNAMVMTRILVSMFMGHAPTVTSMVMIQTPANMSMAVVREVVILMRTTVTPVSMSLGVVSISPSST